MPLDWRETCGGSRSSGCRSATNTLLVSSGQQITSPRRCLRANTTALVCSADDHRDAWTPVCTRAQAPRACLGHHREWSGDGYARPRRRSWPHRAAPRKSAHRYLFTARFGCSDQYFSLAARARQAKRAKLLYAPPATIKCELSAPGWWAAFLSRAHTVYMALNTCVHDWSDDR